jgi:hypothetical protein
MFISIILQEVSVGTGLAAVVISAFIGGVIGIISGYFTYLYSKPKQGAEITQLGSATKKTETENIILSGDTLIKWIEKFEAAKSDTLEMEVEIFDLRKELNDCITTRGDCREVLVVTKAKLESVSEKLASLLGGLEDSAGIMSSLAELKDSLEQRIATAKSNSSSKSIVDKFSESVL